MKSSKVILALVLVIACLSAQASEMIFSCKTQDGKVINLQHEPQTDTFSLGYGAEKQLPQLATSNQGVHLGVSYSQTNGGGNASATTEIHFPYGNTIITLGLMDFGDHWDGYLNSGDDMLHVACDSHYVRVNKAQLNNPKLYENMTDVDSE